MDNDTMFRPLADDEIVPAGRTAPDAWTPIMPVTANAPQLTTSLIMRFAKPGFRLTTGYRYKDGTEALLGCVVRFDKPANGTPTEKDYVPLTFCEGPDGKREWRKKSWPAPRPLYGLDRLAAQPHASVVVVEGEKAADAAPVYFPDHVVTTSPGGSNAASKADWSAVKGRHVIVWPDNDDPGRKYAEEVAKLATAAGAASVRIVKVPAAFPPKWDLGDALPDGFDVAKLTELLNSAEQSTEGPIPLFPPLPPAEEFPINALGHSLSRAASAIARKVQVPEAIAAQSVLAAAALAAQAHADVMLPYGQKRPLSLFFVTVAASGDRKSTADNEALWPIRKREKTLKEEFEAAFKEYAIASAAYGAEKKKTENNKNLDYDGRKQELAALGPEPEKPLHPFLTAPEPTMEGLVKAWIAAHAALGIFTAEGGQFIGGHGMSDDNRLRTAAGYSEIWDGHPIKRVRSIDGVSVLFGRRLSMHLMVQHDAAAKFLADDLLRDQGLLSRVLVAAPDSIAGTRFYRDTLPEDDAAIRAYGARILSILEAPWPLVEGSRNELEPRVLTITAEATAAWRAFYNHIEQQCGPGGDLRQIQDFAAKIAEHAARIAGVLTIVEDLYATEIGMEAMTCALTLADWYVAEACRLQQAARTDSKLLVAQQLLDWLHDRREDVIGFREIVRLGPNPIRTKAAAEEALAILSAHGWITEASARPRKIRVVREA